MIEYDFYPDFTTASFKIDFEGSYANYMDFINKIKNENKSLVIDNSIITKKDGNILTIKSTYQLIIQTPMLKKFKYNYYFIDFFSYTKCIKWRVRR